MVVLESFLLFTSFLFTLITAVTYLLLMALPVAFLICSPILVFIGAIRQSRLEAQYSKMTNSLSQNKVKSEVLIDDSTKVAS